MGLIEVIVLGTILFLVASVKIVNEYERVVVFRLGRVLDRSKGPGIVVLIPFIDKMVKVSLRVVAMDVPSQDVITKDNISIKVNAVVYFRVVEPVKAVVNVENYLYATSEISQTTLRSVCGEVELDELLSQRDKINLKLQNIIDKQTSAWGVKVVAVELKTIDLSEELRRAMSKQAEAERERRAKIIQAEAEYQSAQKLVEAGQLLSKHPLAIQLRYLETLNNISQNPSNTIIVPFPSELIDIINRHDNKST